MMRCLWMWIVFAAVLPAAVPWQAGRIPRIYGERIPTERLMPSKRDVQKRIVRYHNVFRTRVTPTAANMLRLKWHKGAAKAAQRLAEACIALTHDTDTGRHIDAFGSCGQNIFIATAKVPWVFAIKSWFMERELFNYGPGATNDLSKIGHYTQMVWATTHRVGCGWAKCDGTRGPGGQPYFSYVCNYCPIGNNEDTLSTPYVEGASCSSCEGHCHRGKLCTNACPWADFWSNCRQLYDTMSSWLCHSDTEQGHERRKFCRATCNCPDKIV